MFDQPLAEAELEPLRALRRELHRHPEPGGAERETAARVRSALADLPLEWSEVAGTGMVAELRGAPGGPTVAWRAELDALALEEVSGVEWASRRAGLMHACGHDGHLALAVGAARLLAARRREWTGSVRFLFQPDEEEGGGARQMMAAGVLRGVRAVLAVHVRPQVPLGKIELDPIPNAAADAFDVTLRGRGGHGAYPHRGRDALLAACELVVELQAVVSRVLPPLQPAVVTVGELRAGSARNALAETARLRGTLRTRDPGTRQLARDSIARRVAAIGEALGVEAELAWGPAYPRVRCHDDLLALAAEAGRELLGPDGVLAAGEPTMGADDFAFYLEEQGGVPGALVRLGVGGSEPLHSPRYDFDDRALTLGVPLVAEFALRALTFYHRSQP